MKKVVYLAPIFLLSFLGKGALANQVEHVSNLDSALEQASAINNSTADTNKNTTVLQSQVLRINKTNQTAIPDSIKQSTGFQDEEIAANTNVTINDLANNKVHVHYVDANGNAVDNSSHDYTIDVAKTGQGSYTVPSGYQLNYPDGKYTVSGGAFNGTNLKGNVWHTEAETEPDYSNLTTGNRYIDTILKNRNMMKPEASAWYEASGQGSVGYPSLDVYSDHATAGSFPVYSYVIDGSYGYDGHEEIRSIKLPNKDAVTDTSDILNFIHNYTAIRNNNDFVVRGKVGTKVITPAYDAQQLPVAFVDSNNNIVGMIQNYSGKVGTTQNVSLTVPTGYKLADGASLPTSVTFQNSTNPLLVKVVPSGKKTTVTPSEHTLHIEFVDQATGKEVAGGYDLDINTLTGNTGTYNVPAGYSANNNSYQINKAITLGTESFNNNNDRDARSVPLTSIMTKSQANKMYADFKKIKNIVNSKGFDVENNELDVSFNNSYESPSSPSFGHSKWDSSFDHVGRIPGVHGNNFVYGVVAHRKGTDWVYSVNFSLPTFTISSLTQSELKQIHQKYLETFKNNVQSPLDMFMSEHNYPVSITDTGNMVSGDTITVPVHQTNSFSFADNSGNVKSYSGNTVNVILKHQTKRIDPNNSSLNLDANNQLHLINTNQEQPKQSTANFKVGYLLDLVTNNKIIDTNNAQALNNTKIFTVNPSLPIGYDSLNTKLLTLNL